MIAIADVAVVVSDAKAAATWWTQNLGFAVYTVGSSGHAIMVAPPGDRFVLHMCEGISALEPGDTGIAFVTDELDALTARMVKGGVEFPEPVRKQAWGGRSGKFADPDGNIFWLMEVPSKFVEATLRSCAPPAKAPRPRPRARSRKRSSG